MKDDRKSERDTDLDRYVGVYKNIWGQDAIVRWKGGLALLDLTTRAPKEAMVKLKPSEDQEHTFRRIRKDDDSLGEAIRFEVDEEGRVRRLKHNSSWSVKVR